MFPLLTRKLQIGHAGHGNVGNYPEPYVGIFIKGARWLEFTGNCKDANRDECQACVQRSIKKFTQSSREFEWSQESFEGKPWLSMGIMKISKDAPHQNRVGITVWKTPIEYENQGTLLRSCDFSTAELACANGRSLQITSAWYGRSSSSSMTAPTTQNKLTYICGVPQKSCTKEVDVLTLISNDCSGFQQCRVPVSKQLSQIRGKESCEAGSNYVEIQYTCTDTPPRANSHGFEQKPLGSNLEEKLKAFDKAKVPSPLRGEGFARALPFQILRFVHTY